MFQKTGDHFVCYSLLIVCWSVFVGPFWLFADVAVFLFREYACATFCFKEVHLPSVKLLT